jgi:hypothetical protein
MVVFLGSETGRELTTEVSLSDELPKHMLSIRNELTQLDFAGLG